MKFDLYLSWSKKEVSGLRSTLKVKEEEIEVISLAL